MDVQRGLNRDVNAEKRDEEGWNGDAPTFLVYAVHRNLVVISPLRPTFMERPIPASKRRLSALSHPFTL
jgi:hypothetical protein